jgi:hypothetical protein
MKETIPIAAISIQDISGCNLAVVPHLLSDNTLIENPIIDLFETSGDVAYLLILEDKAQKISYPAYAKRYEVVIPLEGEVETEGNIKYRKIAEYNYDSFEVQFDKDNIPSNIVVETEVN